MAGLPSEASLNELGRVAVSLQEHFKALRSECHSAIELVATRTQQLHVASERSLRLAQFISELGAVLERFNARTDVSALAAVDHPPVEGAIEDLTRRLEAQFAKCEADVEMILSQVGKFVLVASFSQSGVSPAQSAGASMPVRPSQRFETHESSTTNASELRSLLPESGEHSANAGKPGIELIPLPVESSDIQDGDTYCIDDDSEPRSSDSLERSADSGLMFFEMSPTTSGRKGGGRVPTGRRTPGGAPASPRRPQVLKNRSISTPPPHTPTSTQHGPGLVGQSAECGLPPLVSGDNSLSEKSGLLSEPGAPVAASTPTTSNVAAQSAAQVSAAELTSGESGERHLVLQKTSVSLGLRICGGRDTGVFVAAVVAGSAAAKCGLRTREQLLMFNGSDFRCVTHSVAGRAMLGLSGDVRVVVKANLQGFDQLPRGAETQDYFFIRIRISRPPGSKKSLQDFSFAVGDVFLITETAPHAHDGAWKANQVVITNGTPKEKNGYLPSFSRAVQMQQAAATKTGGTGGFPPYEAVVPCKVRGQRPVILLGVSQNVTSLRSHLLKEYESVFATCPVYDVIGNQDITGRDDVVLLTSPYDHSRQVYVYKTSLQQAAEKGLHCLLDVPAQDVSGLIAAGIHPIVVLLLKNKTVVAAREEYGLLWLNTGNVTLSGVTRRDGQAVVRIVQEQQQNITWTPHPVALTVENS